MSSMTRVNMNALATALNGDTAVADAIGNALNGSAMNAYTPVVSGGSASGVWAQIGTLTYVEIILTATGPATVTLPFTHQGFSNTVAVLHGCSAAGVSVNAICPPSSAVLTLHKFDGSALPAGTYYISGCYESDQG
jgi:hypothetical protein